MNAANGRRSNSVPDLRPGHAQAVRNVLVGFRLRQRFQVEAGNHALRQLLQLGACQHVAQFGLANQDDLQQLAFAGFRLVSSRNCSNTSDDRVLRLVDDQHIVLAHRVGAQQELVEPVQIGLDRGVGRVQVFAGDAKIPGKPTAATPAPSAGLKM